MDDRNLFRLAQTIGDAHGLVSSRVEENLERLREFIEGHETPTGAWRGEIREGA